MKKIVLSSLLALSASLLNAQSALEAGRINLSENFGTASSMGLAGAFNGLGADVSSISYNPANAGNLSKNEFSMSPYFGLNHSLSNDGGYLNSKANLAFANMSLLLVNGDNRWTFQYQRMADFHQRLSDNYNGSILNHWEDQANSSGATSLNEL